MDIRLKDLKTLKGKDLKKLEKIVIRPIFQAMYSGKEQTEAMKDSMQESLKQEDAIGLICYEFEDGTPLTEKDIEEIALYARVTTEAYPAIVSFFMDTDTKKKAPLKKENTLVTKIRKR